MQHISAPERAETLCPLRKTGTYGLTVLMTSLKNLDFWESSTLPRKIGVDVPKTCLLLLIPLLWLLCSVLLVVYRFCPPDALRPFSFSGIQLVSGLERYSSSTSSFLGSGCQICYSGSCWTFNKVVSLGELGLYWSYGLFLHSDPVVPVLRLPSQPVLRSDFWTCLCSSEVCLIWQPCQWPLSRSRWFSASSCFLDFLWVLRERMI